MDKTEKRRWTRADILLISVGMLLLLALIGQEIVAFQIEQGRTVYGGLLLAVCGADCGAGIAEKLFRC